MGVPLDSSTSLYCDNKSAMQIAHNAVFHERTKHIEVDCHFIRHHCAVGTVHLVYVPSETQVVDLFTKSLTPECRIHAPEDSYRHGRAADTESFGGESAFGSGGVGVGELDVAEIFGQQEAGMGKSLAFPWQIWEEQGWVKEEEERFLPQRIRESSHPLSKTKDTLGGAPGERDREGDIVANRMVLARRTQLDFFGSRVAHLGSTLKKPSKFPAEEDRTQEEEEEEDGGVEKPWTTLQTGSRRHGIAGNVSGEEKGRDSGVKWERKKRKFEIKKFSKYSNKEEAVLFDLGTFTDNKNTLL
ncbi:hypothetical protein H6P81_002501 [Aristolochia fimbriata]|uniref:Uncharacterized protein n=1 Tax=Aristolochia fimbriata TaxID=158543 RepID=A0AAV7FAM3_ARIFI|nr:hypothetical protein H6P81_002501 [Aristolochia fimbriata]